ncbi:hypothetical protein [Brevibacillus porteri]|uniref:hypothetical protein n=1 Tax=Brevibacillus porteri TaxID=2126350 RepID=UPI00362A8E55
MKIEINQEFKQVKELVGYPDNRVGEVWVVDKLTLKHTILKNGYLGLGVDEEELKEYFEPHVKHAANNVRYNFENDAKVIQNGMVTVVILSDGSKGVAKCLLSDVYDESKGYEIALTKAKIKSLTKQLKKLSK